MSLLGQARATGLTGGTTLTVPFPTDQTSLSGPLPGLRVGAVRVEVYNQTASGFSLGNVTSVNRTAGQAALITYRADSAADAVTGKSVVLDVERYEFWRNGVEALITVASPVGADNVDPWRMITDSFTWR